MTDAATKAILENTSTTFKFTPVTGRSATWVRLGNGRILSVDTATGKFIALVDTNANEDAGVNEDGMWDMAKVLSYALSGDEAEFNDAIEEVMFTTGHRSLAGGIHRVEATFPHWESRDQFTWCELLTLNDLNELGEVEVSEGLGIAISEVPNALESARGVYGDECIIELSNGREIRGPAHPAECSYVRITVPGIVPLELAYWISDEWRDAPAEVMGALLGAARAGG